MCLLVATGGFCVTVYTVDVGFLPGEEVLLNLGLFWLNAGCVEANTEEVAMLKRTTNTFRLFDHVEKKVSQRKYKGQRCKKWTN